jgi:Arc-like DNA binding domain
MADRNKTATVDLGLRIKEPLRVQIEAAARDRGVSMNAEVVARIEHSFEAGEILDQALDFKFGKTLAGLLMLLAYVLDDTGRFTFLLTQQGRRHGDASEWIHNPFAFNQAVQAAALIFEMVRPEEEIESLIAGVPPGNAYLGRRFAAEALTDIALADPNNMDAYNLRGSALRERLGSAVHARLAARISSMKVGPPEG